MLRGVVENYAKLQSYWDTATIRSHAIGRTYNAQICTAYQSPHSICVQIKSNGRVVQCAIAHRTLMGNWSDGRGWRDASTESSVMAGVYGGTAFLGRAGHWITSLLLPSEMAYSRTLGELSDVACVSTSRSCSLLRGTIKDTSLTLFVDPKTRLINTIDLEDPNVNAHIKYDPVADPSLDFNRIAAQVKEAPDRWLSFSAIVQRTV